MKARHQRILSALRTAMANGFEPDMGDTFGGVVAQANAYLHVALSGSEVPANLRGLEVVPYYNGQTTAVMDFYVKNQDSHLVFTGTRQECDAFVATYR